MIFLRHPTPKVEPGTCYGRLDLDIAEEGHGEIERAMALTPRITRILASPALRCRRLAETLASRDAVEPIFDERLWEMDMGEWEGLAWRDIPREHSEPWIRDPFNLPTPGGESFGQLQVRVLEAISEIDRQTMHRTAIICHAGPIRAVQMAWQGLTFREAFSSTPPYSQPVELHPPE